MRKVCEIRPRLRVIRLELERMLEISTRFGRLTGASLKDTKIVPTVSVVRSQLQRRLLLDDCLVQLAGLAEHLRQFGMHLWRIGPQPHCLT